MQRYGLDMIRRGALRACFQLTEQEKKYLLLIAGLFMLGLMGRFFFQASDAPLASEPYQKGGVYECVVPFLWDCCTANSRLGGL